MDERSLHVEVHFAQGMFWAQVSESEWGGVLCLGGIARRAGRGAV
jgi:hypothetical protein